MDSRETVSVSGRELEAAKRATNERTTSSAVRTALRFTAKYYGRPAYALALDLDRLHPDTLKSMQNHKAGRTRSFGSAKECFETLRAESGTKVRNKVA